MMGKSTEGRCGFVFIRPRPPHRHEGQRHLCRLSVQTALQSPKGVRRNGCRKGASGDALTTLRSRRIHGQDPYLGGKKVTAAAAAPTILSLSKQGWRPCTPTAVEMTLASLPPSLLSISHIPSRVSSPRLSSPKTTPVVVAKPVGESFSPGGFTSTRYPHCLWSLGWCYCALCRENVFRKWSPGTAKR
jgi:hypothetical protein